MCNISCEQESEKNLQVQQRRSFLKLVMTSALGVGISTTGLKVMATSGMVTLPAQPENVLTPEAALERLIAGNERYVAGQSTLLNFSLESEALARSQNPYACILSCSDSRVSPELCFDEQLGICLWHA